MATLDAAELRTALTRVLPAVSRAAEKDLEALQGVRLEPSEGSLTLAATDRYRLAAADIALDGGGDMGDVLTPAALLDAAVRAMADGAVQLSATGGAVGLSTATHHLMGRQIAAEFPRWRGLLPDPCDEHRALVDAEELVRAVEQARVMSVGDDSSNVAVTFDEGGIRVAAEDGARAAHAELDPLAFAGPQAELKFRPQYLRDALTGCASDVVAIDVHAKRRLVVCRPATADGDITPGYRHLVMGTLGVRR